MPQVKTPLTNDIASKLIPVIETRHKTNEDQSSLTIGTETPVHCFLSMHILNTLVNGGKDETFSRVSV